MTENRTYLVDGGKVFKEEDKIYIDKDGELDPDPIGTFTEDNTFVLVKQETNEEGEYQYMRMWFSAGLSKKAVDEILTGSEIDTIRLELVMDDGYTIMCEEPLNYWVYRSFTCDFREKQYQRNINQWGQEEEGKSKILYEGERFNPKEFERKKDFILDEAQESLPEPDTEDKPVDEEDFQTEEGQNSIDNFTSEEDEESDDSEIDK